MLLISLVPAAQPLPVQLVRTTNQSNQPADQEEEKNTHWIIGRQTGRKIFTLVGLLLFNSTKTKQNICFILSGIYFAVYNG